MYTSSHSCTRQKYFWGEAIYLEFNAKMDGSMILCDLTKNPKYNNRAYNYNEQISLIMSPEILVSCNLLAAVFLSTS